MVKDEIIKKNNIEQLDRKVLNELIDMIYIIDKTNIKIEFKNRRNSKRRYKNATKRC